jgi:hypothetical protein
MQQSRIEAAAERHGFDGRKAIPAIRARGRIGEIGKHDPMRERLRRGRIEAVR